MSVEEFAGKYYKGKQNVFASNRMVTFTNWPFNDDAPCNAVKVAEAGFLNTTTKKSAPCAACAFCLIELEFEKDDDPWNEHVKRGAKCEFVQLNKRDERTWTVKDYMELLGAAHVTVEARRYKADFEKILLAGSEVQAFVATLKK